MDEQEALRRYVEDRFEGEKKKRRIVLFILSLIISIVMLIVGFGIDLEAGRIVIAVGMGIALMLQSLATYLDSTKDGDRQIRRQLLMEARIKRTFGGLDNEIDEMFDRPKEKPKREGRVSLSQDGELVPEDEEFSEDEKPSRKSSSNLR